MNRFTNVVAYLRGARRYRRIDWQTVERLTFVCKGNIARSAYAAAKARSIGLDAVSFGVETHDDKNADPSAVRVAATRGIDLTEHRTTSMPSARLKRGDLILAMEPYQAQRADVLAAKAEAQVTLLGVWCAPPRPKIFDPYGRADAVFNECFEQIDEALHHIQNRIRG